MPFTYEHNRTLQIVEVWYSGKVTARDLQEATSQLIALEKEPCVNRFLVDAEAAEFSASLADLFNLPTKQYIEEGAERSGRVACLLPTSPKEKQAMEFYETVCRNRGWMVQVFAQRQDAIDWLTGSASANKPTQATVSTRVAV